MNVNSISNKIIFKKINLVQETLIFKTKSLKLVKKCYQELQNQEVLEHPLQCDHFTLISKRHKEYQHEHHKLNLLDLHLTI